MFGRSRPYNRSETLDRAERARAKGRRKQAIAEYRKVLAQDPADLAVHQKIAPLLAQTGQRADALKSFDAAAQAHLKQGFTDRAISVYAQAAAFFPKEERLWNELGRLHRERARRADAVKVYVEAHRHFRAKSEREKAIAFLRSALEIDPVHIDASLLLAKLLKASGKKQDAAQLLERLAKQVFGKALKRIRNAQFWLSPTPAALWRWMRAK
jgi:tetratricopeptide (TPR) repeat protein